MSRCYIFAEYFRLSLIIVTTDSSILEKMTRVNHEDFFKEKKISSGELILLWSVISSCVLNSENCSIADPSPKHDKPLISAFSYTLHNSVSLLKYQSQSIAYRIVKVFVLLLTCQR